MLAYDQYADLWTQAYEPETLEEALYDALGIAYAKYDYLREQACGEITPAIDQVDAYITGIEKLLAWEG